MSSASADEISCTHPDIIDAANVANSGLLPGVYYKYEESGQTWYCCMKCHTRYKHRQSAYRHARLAKSECGQSPKFKCGICEKSFVNEGHIACPKCYKYYKNEKTMRSHLSHDCKSETYCCDMCSYTCKRRYSMKIHMERRHSRT
ncbi:hypothetical protein JTB14_036094 [Gonioctena quinquepunctata]|nr:hypothetical protein JTB14_036094 [Gonioctena quinquepunctata]